MRQMNINLKEKVINYEIDQKLKNIAIKTLELVSEGKSEENIKSNIEREINNLVREE